MFICTVSAPPVSIVSVSTSVPVPVCLSICQPMPIPVKPLPMWTSSPHIHLHLISSQPGVSPYSSRSRTLLCIASIVRAFCCSLLLALPSVSVSPLLSPLQCPSPVSISIASPASLLHTHANPHNRAYRKGKLCREPRLCHPHHWFCDSFASEEIERIKQLGRSKLSTGWISLVLVSVGLLSSFCSSFVGLFSSAHTQPRAWKKAMAKSTCSSCQRRMRWNARDRVRTKRWISISPMQTMTRITLAIGLNGGSGISPFS